MTDPTPDLTDLVDRTLEGDRWDVWLQAHPEAASEVDAARRVRALLLVLQAAQITVPDDFQARLMQRIHDDTTLLHLIDLGLSGFGHAFLELLAALFALLPAAQPQPAP